MMEMAKSPIGMTDEGWLSNGHGVIGNFSVDGLMVSALLQQLIWLFVAGMNVTCLLTYLYDKVKYSKKLK